MEKNLKELLKQGELFVRDVTEMTDKELEYLEIENYLDTLEILRIENGNVFSID